MTLLHINGGRFQYHLSNGPARGAACGNSASKLVYTPMFYSNSMMAAPAVFSPLPCLDLGLSNVPCRILERGPFPLSAVPARVAVRLHPDFFHLVPPSASLAPFFLLRDLF